MLQCEAWRCAGRQNQAFCSIVFTPPTAVSAVLPARDIEQRSDGPWHPQQRCGNDRPGANPVLMQVAQNALNILRGPGTKGTRNRRETGTVRGVQFFEGRPSCSDSAGGVFRGAEATEMREDGRGTVEGCAVLFVKSCTNQTTPSRLTSMIAVRNEFSGQVGRPRSGFSGDSCAFFHLKTVCCRTWKKASRNGD